MLTFVETLIAGVVGTVLMSSTMFAIHAIGWANADMIRALGSLVTRSLDKALAPGLAIHFASGLLFAFPYSWIIGGLGAMSFATAVTFGAGLGLAHGLVVSLLLIAAVSEKHPLEEFREAGLEVAGAHIVGHVAYGVGVAAVVAALGIDWGFRF